MDGKYEWREGGRKVWLGGVEERGIDGWETEREREREKGGGEGVKPSGTTVDTLTSSPTSQFSPPPLPPLSLPPLLNKPLYSSVADFSLFVINLKCGSHLYGRWWWGEYKV